MAGKRSLASSAIIFWRCEYTRGSDTTNSASAPADRQHEVLVLDVAVIAQSLPEGLHEGRCLTTAAEIADLANFSSGLRRADHRLREEPGRHCCKKSPASDH